MKIIKLTEKQYKYLQNVLIWAELYDREKNNYRNQKIAQEINKVIKYISYG